MPRILRVVFLLFLAFAMSNCATVFSPHRKSSMKIYNGRPKNAEIYLNGEFLGKAPMIARLHNKQLYKYNLMEVKADGYVTGRYLIELKADAGYFILDMIGGFVPLIVDYATGNIIKPKPKYIKYILEPEKQVMAVEVVDETPIKPQNE